MTNEIPEAARKWDAHYSSPKFQPDWRPNPRLAKFAADLEPGRAIDLAMGIGHNVLWLARKGWRVEGVEISQVALDMCRKLALQAKYDVRLVHANLTRYALEPTAYDLVVCTYYLDRGMIPALKAAIQKGGAVFFETYTRAYLEYSPGFNPKFLLDEGELPRLWDGFDIVSSCEEDDGKTAFASLVARKR